MVVHDIPLLAESGRAGTFDAVVVVDVPRELQVERMVRDRGWTREDAESRIAAQASREDRLAIATHVVENSGTLEELARASPRCTPRSRPDPELVSAGSSGPGGSRSSTSPPSRGWDGRTCAQAARSGSAILRSLVIASRSSWRTRSAEMPWRAPMSASLCCRPSTSP